MKSIFKSLGLVVLLGNFAMADLPTGTFGFDMKSTLKANGTADEQMTYMLKNMSNVLNEFLATISKGFMDAAFASFKRRRSTVREDIDQSFGGVNKNLPEEAYKSLKTNTATKGSIDISHKKKTVASDLGLKEL